MFRTIENNYTIVPKNVSKAEDICLDVFLFVAELVTVPPIHKKVHVSISTVKPIIIALLLIPRISR